MFEKISGAGTFSNDPPAGTTARTGTMVITNSSITTTYGAREIQSADCIALLNDSSPVNATIYGEASTANGTNELRGRITMLWFTDAGCTTAATPADDADTAAILPQGSYVAVTYEELPATGATHFKIRFEVRDDNGGVDNADDDWAGDDVWVGQ